MRDVLPGPVKKRRARTAQLYLDAAKPRPPSASGAAMANRNLPAAEAMLWSCEGRPERCRDEGEDYDEPQRKGLDEAE